ESNLADYHNDYLNIIVGSCKSRWTLTINPIRLIHQIDSLPENSAGLNGSLLSYNQQKHGA
ncbi:hypothetical protein, partial [Citrobacter freundii]|uniref:hypothetical protein n=2 Tax=Enterobacteriaceae TaxID=543 RepID=UPI00292B4A34|nr:hypothetical protein [Citrobacter freundii]MDV1386821.1 hypothetical protein [Citrobacter freundii]MDV1397812.1 hypothetical protein [Citrobacter freundii]MDV1407691.1 hypothetical protein [Citrobacter freundii]MDV1412924.1 hypothetical protein [Citrobacter freundii]